MSEIWERQPPSGLNGKMGYLRFVGIKTVEERPHYGDDRANKAMIAAGYTHQAIFEVILPPTVAFVTEGRGGAKLREEPTEEFRYPHNITLAGLGIARDAKLKVEPEGEKAGYEFNVRAWTWNGSIEKASLEPSILSWNGERHDDPRDIRWHIFLRNGKVDLLSDSTLVLME